MGFTAQLRGRTYSDSDRALFEADAAAYRAEVGVARAGQRDVGRTLMATLRTPSLAGRGLPKVSLRKEEKVALGRTFRVVREDTTRNLSSAAFEEVGDFHVVSLAPKRYVRPGRRYSDAFWLVDDEQRFYYAARERRYPLEVWAMDSRGFAADLVGHVAGRAGAGCNPAALEAEAESAS